MNVIRLVVDLFPPTPRDPHALDAVGTGRHQAIWDELGEERFEAVPGKPLIAASFLGGDLPTAYVEPLGVGDHDSPGYFGARGDLAAAAATRASFSRRNATQPGTWASLSPCSSNGPLNP